MTSNIPTAFRLNHLDIPSIHKFGIGFDSIFEDIHRLATVAGKDNYPPYNVIKIDDDHFAIELALAGIDKEALDIELDQNQLTISTKKVEAPTDEGKFEDKITELEYLHKGISSRSFSRAFTLADHVIVTGADMHNGILKISLERQLPEELKPRKIDISSAK
tara:strand:+ start:31 stop:516 length:486 start_codon:yes stop_codon:yes gene_type:complete